MPYWPAGVTLVVPTTDEPAKARSCTVTGWVSANEKPTQTFTRLWGVLKLARTGAVQNSTPTQGSTATLPECAKPGSAKLPFE